MRALILVPADREHKTVNDVMEVTGMRAIAVVGWLGIVVALIMWQGVPAQAAARRAAPPRLALFVRFARRIAAPPWSSCLPPGQQRSP